MKSLIIKILKIFIVIIIILFFAFWILTYNIATYVNTNAYRELEKYKKGIELLENKEKYLENDNNLFKETQIVKNVGITKYNDFYILTDKNHVLLPYGRTLLNNNPPPARPYQFDTIFSNDIRLSNLKKLLNKEIKVKVLANKNLSYGFKINEKNLQDVYPLNEGNYYMVDITFDGFFLDMNFNPCNSSYSTENGFHCNEDIKSIYPRQKWWEGEDN